ncbi:MAG: preprotein translocase subunit SecA, partial [Lachnospiraceae bacterium]|nr:preprotein translocase subunit SecA [Lachnospiraceae bacterium]
MAGSKVSRRYKRILKKINQLAPTMEAMTNEELQAQTEKFKARYEKGESLDSLLVEAYATIREAAKRVLHMYPYDVQMLGAIVLHEG